MTKKRIPSQNHTRKPPPKHLNLHNNGNHKHSKDSKLVHFFAKQYKFAIESGEYFIYSRGLALLAIALDAVLTVNIIQNVSYTEIDWSTYMAQVSAVFSPNKSNTTRSSTFPSFNFDYSTIKGPTGPLVYPAGHVYIFKILYELTEKGTNILKAQYMFAAIYIAQLILVYKIYFHRQTLKVPPYIFVFLTLTSYRIHSIYVLRLFNDPIAILFAYASFYALLRKRHNYSAALFGIALSIKMNVLLFAPAYALIFYEDKGLAKSIQKAMIVFNTQVILGLPFLITNPVGYLKRAFDFGRVFEHKWTVNWRFLDEETFTSKNFFIGLLVVHCCLLLYMFGPRLIQLLLPGRISKRARQDPFLTLAIANFVGIACSRSLHYQFYVWYYHSLPIILWATNYSVLVKLLIFGIVEFCWNQYPSTSISSLMLHTCHLVILVSLLTRATGGEQSGNSTNNNSKKHNHYNSVKK